MVATVPLGANGVVVTWDVPTATDNSQLPVALIAQTGGVPGMTFPPGEVTVSYTFSDTSGNEAVCSFLVVTSGTRNLNLSLRILLSNEAYQLVCLVMT